MRYKKLYIVSFLVLFSGISNAQGWTEHVYLNDFFTINFPGDPEINETTYLSEFDATYPARVYTVNSQQSLYSVTVVDFTDAQAIHAAMEKTEAATSSATWINDQRAAVSRAAREMRSRGGEITHDAWSHIDRVEGLQLQMTNSDNSRTYAGIYMNGNSSRLFILEATVAPRSIPPGQFQQSLGFVDSSGNRIRYQLSANGCTI
tara:strand:- start:165 stop:776 length:612 start_codon:yes stop_codon:yes gene_type:complete